MSIGENLGEKGGKIIASKNLPTVSIIYAEARLQRASLDEGSETMVHESFAQQIINSLKHGLKAWQILKETSECLLIQLVTSCARWGTWHFCSTNKWMYVSECRYFCVNNQMESEEIVGANQPMGSSCVPLWQTVLLAHTLSH